MAHGIVKPERLHVPAFRQHLRPAQHRPTIRRDPTDVYDEEVGGRVYWVEYLSEPIGFALTCWTLADGVHWEVIDKFGRRYITPLPTLEEAKDLLMRLHGWEPKH